MQRSLEAIWYGSGNGMLLRPLSVLYASAQRVRAGMYRSGALRAIHPGRPVIVVGNLTVGGTGKTPLVQWLAAELAALGRRVGIASRGYGRAGAGVRTVEADTSWREVGDEPLLLARRTRALTVVGKDRVAAARQLVALGADVIVSDDGLQHLRLARDCEIVVVDGARLFGNGRLLPSGPLREPVHRLQSVDAIVLNGPVHGRLPGLKDDGSVPVFAMRVVPEGVLPLDGRGPAESLSDYRGRSVHAVAGIGNPSRFFALLRDHGLRPIEHVFPDHYVFEPPHLRFGDGLPVLMTEKDAVKCLGFGDSRMRCVRVNAAFDERQARELIELVLRRIDRD
jgi:tetraacyldisaccharide 4'-kinase